MEKLEKYKDDLENLIAEGDKLHLVMQFECYPADFEKQVKPKLKAEYDEFIKKIRPFKQDYQTWYSESLVLLRQLLQNEARITELRQLKYGYQQ